MNLPHGYEIHELPDDYTGPVWIEGQLMQFAYSIKPLLEDALYALEYASELHRPGECDCYIYAQRFRNSKKRLRC